METLLFILLIVIALTLLSGGFRTQAPPQIVYVEAPPEPSRRSFGCLPWIVGCVVLLVLLGVIRCSPDITLIALARSSQPVYTTCTSVALEEPRGNDMTMYALIEHKPEGKYTASLIGWPGITAQGGTEDEALARLRQSLTTRLGEARIVPLDVELAPAENPWLQLGEQFKDNPLLDEVTESIAEHRRQLDATNEES